MTQKTLRPTTIIPASLYVERAADRQLRSIIDDMGRPGYVLVARQMGKTNLLINMKRERSTDVVLYLDLSNRFDSVRAWFRNVIDALIESYPDFFNAVSPIVSQQRKDDDLQPNVEYDRHLRLLLRTIDRKFVIVLDEIDSLVNAPYSDIILAQIRSMYFSRVNYAEYERLTYVLSGVAEPNDLIKDKNISPFNIGEKIYLEDFSREEFDEFLVKAGLSINGDAADTIYYWAGGNPRMTWDICSELEDRFLNGECLSKDMVNTVVEKLYLRDFDRAPVDHIRSLVESDIQIRDALVSIRFRNFDFVDDRTKSRLYLSGITRSAAGGTIDVKNRIIDEALSDRWLSQISNTRATMLKLASESFKEGKYKEAIIQFEAVFADSTFAEMIQASTRFEFALSYFYSGNMARAAQEFERCAADTEDPINLQNLGYFLGLTRGSQGDLTASIELLEKAANGPDRTIQITAKLALMQALLRINPTLYGKQVIDTGNELIRKLSEPECLVDESDLEFLVAAIHNVGIAHTTLGNYSSAAQEYEHALTFARQEWKNTLLLRQYDIERDAAVRIELALQAAKVIIENKLDISVRKNDSLQLNETRLLQSLYRLLKHEQREAFDDLIKYAANRIYRNKLSVAEVLLQLYESAGNEEKRSAYISILEKAYNDYGDGITTPALRMKFLRPLSLYTDVSRLSTWRQTYIGELTSYAALGSIEDDDFGALTAAAFTLLRSGAHKELEKLLDLSKSFEAKRTDKPSQWIVLMAYCEMEFQSKIGKKKSAEEVASRLISLLDKADLSHLNDETSSMLPEIRTRASALLPRKPITRDPANSFGRNQKVRVQYGNGVAVERKFKQVEVDLREGRCTLVN